MINKTIEHMNNMIYKLELKDMHTTSAECTIF